MTQIRRLPEHIVSQIAAGEVIERQAYAVKELLENARDAKATEIKIDIENSGLSLIKVIDNGEGISKNDLPLSFQPHTTSKLNENDLTGITTLGFRGEALASIASISTLTLQSRTKNELFGHTITVNNLKASTVTSVGMPKGSVVTVEDLFANVPARKRFLKSPATELRKIVDVVTLHALSDPTLRIILNHNNRTIIDVPEESFLERITSLTGKTMSQHLIPFAFKDSYISLNGYIGKPEVSASTPAKLYVFVNGRPVTDKTIQLAVKEGFSALLGSNEYPSGFVYLRVPAEFVDVNIHPRKEIVHFIDQRFLFDTVTKAVLESLSKHNITSSYISSVRQNRGVDTELASQLKQSVLPKNPLARTQITKGSTVTQLHNSYLLVQSKNGFILIDQHAAHERVLYEQFRKNYKRIKSKLEKKKVNIALELTKSEILIVDQYLNELQKLGFNFEKKKNKYWAKEIPKIFEEYNIPQLINDILFDLSEEISIKDVDTKSNEMLKTLSCRSAIKSGDPLSQTDAKKLIKQLQKTPNYQTCPHGRPTHILFTTQELEKLFKRT